jgi:hypothetical protein
MYVNIFSGGGGGGSFMIWSGLFMLSQLELENAVIFNINLACGGRVARDSPHMDPENIILSSNSASNGRRYSTKNTETLLTQHHQCSPDIADAVSAGFSDSADVESTVSGTMPELLQIMQHQRFLK